MIFIAMGSNLPHPDYGTPQNVCEAALVAMARAGLVITRQSSWLKTRPVPISDQPWFVNGVVAIETALTPTDLLLLLHRIEADFGRVRSVQNAARILDLDVLAWGDLVTDDTPILPHPRLHQRGFVLYPLAEIAPEWRHPVSGLDVKALIAALPPDQQLPTI